jgi:ribosomal-protein-alanine N-acetyltransferase
MEAEYASMTGNAVSSVRRLLVVAEQRDGASIELVGFAVGKVIGRAGSALGELESVAVAASARRSGVGRALCEAVIDWCGEQGVEAVELEVRSKSEGAAALYRGLGFVAVGLRKRYYRDPEDDAILMSLSSGLSAL